MYIPESNRWKSLLAVSLLLTGCARQAAEPDAQRQSELSREMTLAHAASAVAPNRDDSSSEPVAQTDAAEADESEDGVITRLPAQSEVGTVDTEDLDSAAENVANWLTHGRTYDGQRFSPLRQINKQNVDKLIPKGCDQFVVRDFRVILGLSSVERGRTSKLVETKRRRSS